MLLINLINHFVDIDDNESLASTALTSIIGFDSQDEYHGRRLQKRYVTSSCYYRYSNIHFTVTPLEI